MHQCSTAELRHHPAATQSTKSNFKGRPAGRARVQVRLVAEPAVMLGHLLAFSYSCGWSSLAFVCDVWCSYTQCIYCVIKGEARLHKDGHANDCFSRPLEQDCSSCTAVRRTTPETIQWKSPQCRQTSHFIGGRRPDHEGVSVLVHSALMKYSTIYLSTSMYSSR